jgi:hypothetical protein
MPNSDDGLTGLLQTPKSPESASAESDPDPDRRSSGKALLIALVALFIPIGILFVALKDRPGGIQIVAIVAYTLLIPYIASDRFLNLVPWDRLTCGKFLLVHFLTLAIVYGITTGALAAKPYLPPWFTTEGRKGSFFDLCLMGILLALALCECSWGSKHEGEETPEVD